MKVYFKEVGVLEEFKWMSLKLTKTDDYHARNGRNVMLFLGREIVEVDRTKPTNTAQVSMISPENYFGLFGGDDD